MKFRCYRFFFLTVLLLAKTCLGLSQEDIRFDKILLPDENLPGLITGITQDLAGNIWFTSSADGPGFGIYQYDGVHMKFYTHDDLNPSSLSTGRIESICADKNGNIWAGTYGAGLEKLDPKTGHFAHYKHDKTNPASISGDSITCILLDHEGFLWVGTFNTGLDRMDVKTGKFIHYRHRDNDPNSLSFLR
jgi:streptogramin lyase